MRYSGFEVDSGAFEAISESCKEFSEGFRDVLGDSGGSQGSYRGFLEEFADSADLDCSIR